jgi:hypothetical protein
MSGQVETVISVKFKSGMVVLREVALPSPHRPDGAALYSNAAHFQVPCGNTAHWLRHSGSVADEVPENKYSAGGAIIRSDESVTLP